MESAPDEVYVDASTLRQRFAALDIIGQLNRGQLTTDLKRDGLAGITTGQPAGTRSQIVHYHRGDELVAIVHQYLLPDGRIGASGLPDPKWLRDGNRILKFRRPL